MTTSLARVKTYLSAARGWLAGVRLLLDPSRLDMVFIMDRDINRDSVDEEVVRLREQDMPRVAIDARRRLVVDVDQLHALPLHTLGRSFVDFLTDNGLDPRAIPTLPATDDGEYVSAHIYETHDLWHVVTGFRTDIAGELGLQAVYAAQFGGNKLTRLLLAGGLLHSALAAPADFSRRLDAIVEGWRVGREARCLFGVPWDDLWDQPLETVRRDLGVRVAS